MAGEKKPKSHTINNSKKGKQRFLPNNRAVRKKGAYPLRPGVQGFFITCDGGRERQAAQEAINVIDSFFEELIHGKGSSINPTGLADKPLGKKIKFSYSDDEGEDNDDVKEEEEDNHEEEEELKDEEEEEVKDEEEKKVKDEEEEKVKDEEEEKVKDAEEEKVKEENKSDILQTDDKNEKAGPSLENSCGENQTEKKTDDNEEGSIDVKKENEAVEPPAKKQRLEMSDSECVAPAKAEEKSIDKLIEEELKELGDKNKRRFFSLDSGCNGVAFIQMRKIDGEPCPKDIVQHMMTSAASTRKHMSRFILRVLPVEVACYSSEEEISRAIAPLVEKYFPADAKDPHKFAVQYGARANTGIDRMKIINAVAKSVPEPHKVDLSNPDKTIIVEIAKTVCLIGVVEKYKELSRYNLRQLTSPKP